jgi:hypothetical protein
MILCAQLHKRNVVAKAPMPKRATQDHLLSLEHPGILAEVLEFVGPGHFAYVAVCENTPS